MLFGGTVRPALNQSPEMELPFEFDLNMSCTGELLAANPAGIPVVVSTWKPIPNDKLLDIDPETLFWLGETENVQFYDLASDVSRFDQPMLHIIRSLTKDPTTNFWFPYTMTDGDSVISD
ncbi:uncharacterized protein N7469_006890 [Penicillium citrinum]|uniref:Uncharacterized protein n=1 Tax=Penicillium citrinum TaxID=5077 RepID=A0A9W9NY64_PENCI|nr:uncharacterized protein N7469_006890 [Penicillium citrinum]KAJ5226884.1 hypothetical protein N7469_006890 [Penicillium citrinum]